MSTKDKNINLKKRTINKPEETTSSNQANVKKQVEVPSFVIYKLLFFSIGIFALPILAYYLSNEYWFKGNGFYSAVIAVVTVNIVLLGYVISAFMEEEPIENKVGNKKKD